MRGFLIIDTEDIRVKFQVTHTQINNLIPIIKKINKNIFDYHQYEGYELFNEIMIKLCIDEYDITSINIAYHK